MARILNLPVKTTHDRVRKIRLLGHLNHGNKGRQNRKPNPDKTQILTAATKYEDFGISHVCELLESRDGISVNRETLRRWLARSRVRKVPKQRQRRDRRPNFGELLQIDGSFHDWFSESKACMINIVDDATNTAELHFDAQETIESACYAAWNWFTSYGVPQAFYADGRNMYHLDPDDDNQNFFTQMCRNLGIRIIMAHSPQAKGRVERWNGVHQRRLVPLMKLDGVRDMADANEYLKKYVVEHNKRYAKPAAGYNVHRPLPDWAECMGDVCFILIERKLKNDWTFSYKGKVYQLPRQSVYPPAKSKIKVKITISGRITAYYRCAEFNVR
ncbi:MAG: ISNCY family transposase [Oscillospiraceae bacterium]|nr:ISNCY family transposase [Oscillospiraceae bacterium]